MRQFGALLNKSDTKYTYRKRGENIMRTNLKVFRIRQQLTQDEIADKIGCPRSTYSAIESGQRTGRPAFWQDLQKAFYIPDAEIWGLMKNE